MKRGSMIAMALVFVLLLGACGQSRNGAAGNAADGTNGAANGAAQGDGGQAATAERVRLKVGATPVPHADILKVVQPLLQEKGIELEIVEFNDYVQPNTQLYEKELDANFFQHKPYLEQFNADKGYDLAVVAGIHIEPFGAYSRKVKKTEELQEGARVAIPNDPSNGGRALALLEANGLIALKEGVGVAGTVADITDNPKKLKFTEVEAATLPRVLDEVDLALINTNYALEAELVPTKDALLMEGADSPYVNILAARQDNKDSGAIRTLAETMQSPEVRTFIEETYKGAVVPAFE